MKLPHRIETRCRVCGEPGSKDRPLIPVKVQFIRLDGFFTPERQALLVTPIDPLWIRLLATRLKMHNSCQPPALESVVLK